MFKLFERQPNWALKQLVQETDQPAVCFLSCVSNIAGLGWRELFSQSWIVLVFLLKNTYMFALKANLVSSPPFSFAAILERDPE